MKKYKLSFVQGRLSPQIGSIYQYFPVDNWQNELMEAKKIGLNNIEWIVSDLSNPIFNSNFLKIILINLKKNKINISSMSLDYLMKEPLYSQKIEDVNWLIKKLNAISTKLGKIRLNIPIEEISGIFNSYQVIKVIKNLKILKKNLSKKFLISLETDMSPKNLHILLNKKELRGIGVNIDIGNIDANGYDIKEYFLCLKKLIYGVHIKNRGLLFSKSKMLESNKSLNYVINNLDKLNNINDLTLQTYKDNKNYKSQLIQNFKLIKKKLNISERI